MAVPVLGFMELPSLILPTITRRNTVSLFSDTGRMEGRANISHVFMTRWDPSTAGSEGMLLPFRKLIKVVPRTREEDGDQSVPHQCLLLSRQFINNFTHFTFKSRSMSIFYGFPCSGSFPHQFPTVCKGICDNDIRGVLKPEVPIRQMRSTGHYEQEGKMFFGQLTFRTAVPYGRDHNQWQQPVYSWRWSYIKQRATFAGWRFSPWTLLTLDLGRDVRWKSTQWASLLAIGLLYVIASGLEVVLLASHMYLIERVYFLL